MTLTLLAQLFRTPIHIPTEAVSMLWAVPLCLSIALIYKAVKIEPFKPAAFIREVAFLFVTIIGALILISICLVAVAALVR